MGGTANLAVRGGNLPPRDGWAANPLSGVADAPGAVGLVARQNGQVARSTRFSTALFRLKSPWRDRSLINMNY